MTDCSLGSVAVAAAVVAGQAALVPEGFECSYQVLSVLLAHHQLMCG